jgi:hypothetical protein
VVNRGVGNGNYSRMVMRTTAVVMMLVEVTVMVMVMVFGMLAVVTGFKW